ncbi:autotransporter assembly complex protein TamA [Endozoicomonas gorgoniicola]|uniref:Translocation and assembly module subunit TamA n=1 Tax=Endozoicomonas gorgoniicola TaxID=1234144 RepID=A0ABT3MSN7_9GAMM|nr:autotransporter assembly complex family protein [Endozoicomonas gorgoniicola]MCW7552395.1 autotransporter assembly complex protein TamA [Endozoicomonas gorgoniicola]
MSPLTVFCHRIITTLALVWLTLSGHALAAPLEFHLSGVDGREKKNVELHLQALPEMTAEAFPLYKHTIKETVQHALEPFGFYGSVVDLSSPSDHSETVDIQIEPGKPVLIKSVNVLLEGDARMEKSFKRLLKAYKLTPEQVFEHEDYETLKRMLMTQAQLIGFFDAHWVVAMVDVNPAEYSADVHLTLDSGRRYRFGELQYVGETSATRRLVEAMLNFAEGDAYDATKLVKLYNDLSASGYFKHVDVQPLRDKAQACSIPVKIDVSPRRSHEMEVGIGFSTDEGPRISLGWNKPWVNDRGHSFNADTYLSAKRTELSTSYQIPRGNPLLDFYSLQTGYQHKNLEDTNSRLYSAALHQWHKVPDGWNRDWFIRVEAEHYNQASDRDNSLLLIPGLALSRRNAIGSLNPIRGTAHDLKIELSPGISGSGSRFIKVWGRTKWLDTFASRHQLLARFEQGATWVRSVSDLPPSLRFFTGGDQTVRGYDYDTIAPKDSDGKLTGGRYLSVVSLEYAYKLVDKWWLALFTDSGISTNDYDDAWKVGSGLGVRWITPLGPLRVDLAFAVSEPGSPWRLHFTIGPVL